MADIDQATPAPKRSRRARRAPETPDPVELAMVQASGSVAAQRLLEKQAFLIDADLEHRRLQIGGERLKRVVWFVLAILAGALLLALVSAVVAASRSRAFVMEPLRVPPALVQRGVDGTVLASRLVDELRSLEARTSSVRASSSYSRSWEEDVRIAIPQTGISLGEAWRYLRDWLGNDVRVQGEAFATETGLGLTVRTGTMPGQTFSGAAVDIDSLVRQAALALYKDSQPYRYGVHMIAVGNLDEAVSAYRLAVGRGGLEAAWGHRGLGLRLRDQNRFEEAIGQYRAALRIVPDHPGTLYVLAQELSFVGRHEEALATFEKAARLFETSAGEDLQPEGRVAMLDASHGEIAAMRHDFRTAAFWSARPSLIGGGASAAEWRKASIAGLLGALHEREATARLLRSVRLGPSGWLAQPAATDNYYRVLAALRADVGDVAGALGAFRRVGEQPGSGGARPLPQEDRARLGYYMALAGDPAEGARVAAASAPDCYPCLVRRVEIAILARDWPAAESFAAQAIRQGPSLPPAYYHHGRQLLARGNVEGALRQFDEAHRRGPRWAEPLRARADALFAQRRLDEALRDYARAAERAPRWGDLHLAWARALWASGRRAEAVAKLRAAAVMGLAPAERARLRSMWAAARRQA